METWQAIVLGIVEGLTEYLPVSSTGHLILAQRAMGIAGGEAADAYAICIQAGAIVAVLGLYYRRVMQMGRGLLGRDPEGLRLLIAIIAGLLPAVVIGLALEHHIKRFLFGREWGLWPTVLAWLVGGLAILVVAWLRPAGRGNGRKGLPLAQLTWRMALIIGLAQCIAMWPGVSRSLVTIVAGVLVGLSLPAAVEFSFLLGVVTLGGATAKDAISHGQVMFDAYGWLPMLLGFVFAFLAAVLAIEWMVNYLKRHGMQIFGYYRVALGVIVGVLIVLGYLA